ncbi:hypothetical protein E1A91_D13G023400v1 [Gossypium mustelinum]|uniref:Uncharacterized protein n=1 Tax=Gossypium mustelinum TaxID=34275 RepID=A0A5D2RZ01_GOSMU|nr:hypothetical protein E1A91_D13G023400v1 [Gossypium mustelinum]
MPHSSTTKTEHWQVFILRGDPYFTNMISNDKNTSSKWFLDIQINSESTEFFTNFRSENPTKSPTNRMQ